MKRIIILAYLILVFTVQMSESESGKNEDNNNVKVQFARISDGDSDTVHKKLKDLFKSDSDQLIEGYIETLKTDDLHIFAMNINENRTITNFERHFNEYKSKVLVEKNDEVNKILPSVSEKKQHHPVIWQEQSPANNHNLPVMPPKATNGSRAITNLNSQNNEQGGKVSQEKNYQDNKTVQSISQQAQHDHKNRQEPTITYNQLLENINSHFKATPELNKKFVDNVKAHEGDYKAYYWDDKTFYSKRQQAINSALNSLSAKFDDRGQHIKNFKLLQNNGVFKKINIEMMTDTIKMKNFIYEQLLELFVKRHFDYHFQDNTGMNDRFAKYVASSDATTDKGKFYLTQPAHFHIFNNDSLMNRFIDDNKSSYVIEVLNLNEEELKRLKGEDIWVKFDAQMMFDRNFLKEKIKPYIMKFSLIKKFKQRFPNDGDVSDLFINFLFDRDEKAMKKFNVELSELKIADLDNDHDMNQFIRQHKEDRIKKVLQDTEANEHEKMELLTVENKVDIVRVDIMFDTEVMKNYLNRKLLEIRKNRFKKYLDDNFSRNRDLNLRFVHFLEQERANMSEYKLQKHQFYDLKDDDLMKRFIDANKEYQVKHILQKFKNQILQQDFDRLVKLNVLQKINIEMMFNPDVMEIFLKNEFVTDCRKEFGKKLHDKLNAWGRTPDKCIIDPICNITQKFWTNNEIENEIGKYPIAERTFDEVDEMFFDLITEDMERNLLSFQGDMDCLIAFIKRSNAKVRWYSIDLIADDEKRKNKVREIVRVFNENYGVRKDGKDNVESSRLNQYNQANIHPSTGSTGAGSDYSRPQLDGSQQLHNQQLHGTQRRFN